MADGGFRPIAGPSKRSTRLPESRRSTFDSSAAEGVRWKKEMGVALRSRSTRHDTFLYAVVVSTSYGISRM